MFLPYTSLTVGPLSHHFRCVKEAHRAVKNQVQILYRVVNDAPHTPLRFLFYNTSQLHSAHINTILITKIEEVPKDFGKRQVCPCSSSTSSSSSSLVTVLFSPVLLLNQRRSQMLSLEVSDCSTFHIVCDVPGMAVFCSESVECLPGVAS